jgi:TIR domain/ClpX C4-type zinc finger
MSNNAKPQERTLHCSFCNKGQNQVNKLICSPPNGRRKAYICDECVEVCSTVLDYGDDHAAHLMGGLEALGKDSHVRPRSESGNFVRIFYSYSHKDEALRNRLEEHLSSLKWAGSISNWHDRKIEAGQVWGTEIDSHLRDADIILLLVSASFLASNYCYGREATYALERHNKGECRVIPVILKPVDWHHTPLANLQALPRDGKPITDWNKREQAFLNVVQGLRSVIQQIRTRD